MSLENKHGTDLVSLRFSSVGHPHKAIVHGIVKGDGRADRDPIAAHPSGCFIRGLACPTGLGVGQSR